MKSVWRTAALLVFLITLVGDPMAHAKNQEAQEAYNAGDKQRAFELWKADAVAGDIDAQLIVANMFATGDGVSQSFDVANIYYRLAADKGQADAQCFLGVNYRFGTGIDVDISEALTLLTEAASSGHGMAQFELAELYLAEARDAENAEGMAAAWYEGAALQGVVFAQVKLANIYRNGLKRGDAIAIPVDQEIALTYLNVAARYARGDLPETSMSNRVYGLDESLGAQGQTLREYILKEYEAERGKVTKEIVDRVDDTVDQAFKNAEANAAETEN